MRIINPYSNEDTSFLIENYKKLSYKIIANALNRTPQSVKDKLQKLGLIKGEPGKPSLNKLESDCKFGARKRGYTYSLTKNEFVSLIGNNCHYCGSPPKPFNLYYKKNRSVPYKTYKDISEEWRNLHWIKANGIDRKDNSVGYILENCIPCCFPCNKAKGGMSYDEFIKYLDNLVEFRLQQAILASQSNFSVL
jgi:hypothetical protein